MATKKKSTAAKSMAKKASKSKSPHKGAHSSGAKHGALLPNKEVRKYADELYGGVKVPFRD